MSSYAAREVPLSTGLVSQRGQFFLVLILVVLLGLTSVAQLLFAVPMPQVFIRWLEVAFAGFFLFEASRSYRAPVIKPLGGWLFLAWIGFATVSVVLAVHPVPALIRHAEWMTHVLFAFTLWHYLQRHPDTVKILFLIIPVGFLLVGLNMAGAWFTLPNPRDYNWLEGIPLIGHARHFGYYGLATLIAGGGLLLGFGEKMTWPKRLLALGGLALCWGFMFWAGGRAAIGSAVLALAFIVWFAGKGRRAELAGIFIVAAALGLWLSTFFAVNNAYMGFLPSLERTATATTAGGVNGFTTGRMVIWSAALSSLEGHWLFGLGPDGYRFLEETHYGIQPHGMPVQILVEWGLVGAIPFLLLLGLIFWKGLVYLRQERDPLLRSARITAFALIAGCTLHSVVDGLYYHAQPLLFLFTCFAIVLLPVTAARSHVRQHPIFKLLTARRTLWGLTILLALFFFANVDWVYLWIIRAFGG